MWSCHLAVASTFRHLLSKMGERPLLTGGALVFLILLVAYSFSIDIRASRGAAITGDEPFYLLTTQSLVDDGDLDLRQQYERHSYKEFFDHPDGLWQQSIPREDGVLLSPHNPGLSVILIPGFALVGLLGAQAQLLVMGALTFALAYVLAAKVTRAPRASWLTTLCLGLAAPAFVYSTEIYPEVPAALLLVASLLIVASKDRLGPWRSLALTSLLSGMVWLGVKYLPLALLVSVFFAVRAQRIGLATFVAATLPSAAIFIWFHLATFGELTPYSLNSVYAGFSTTEVVNSHIDFGDRIYRLWGLFIDRRFGIGRWAPIFLLAVLGLFPLLRTGPVPRLVLALVVVQVGIATFLAITMMGWWFPGRTMMTVLPLFAIPVTLLVKRASGSFRTGAILLVMYSLGVTAALAHAGHSGEIVLAVDPFEMDAPLFQAIAGLFPDYRSWSAETRFLTAIWLALAAAILLTQILLFVRNTAVKTRT